MAATAKALKKLKAHSEHKRKPTRELEQLAIELTSPEKIRERFVHLLEDGYRMAEDIVEEDDRDLLHTLELEAHHQSVKHDTSKACHLPVKLSLQKLQITPPFATSFAKKLKFEYGALHTAIVVGNVVIEWGREELVEPRIDPNFKSEFLANVGDQGEWHNEGEQFQALMSIANKQGDRERKLNIVCEAIDKKAQLINKLVEVIVEYNSNRSYSVFNCNCQDFAREALAALGIKKPVEFKGLLKQRFEALKEDNRKVPAQLQSHENLDMYVEGVKDELELQDLEYLQCLYFSEHLPKIEKSGDPDNWECDVPTCKSAELDRLIGLRSSPHIQLLLKDKPRAHNSQAPLQLNYSSQSQGPHLATASPNPHKQAPSSQRRCSLPTNKSELPRNTNNGSLYHTQNYSTEQNIAHSNESGIFRASATPATINDDRIWEIQANKNPNTPQANGSQKKCPTEGCEFYGTKETSFYCSEHFKINNAPKCDICDKFFGSSDYNGLCYKCHLKRTGTNSLVSPTSPTTMSAPGNIYTPTVSSISQTPIQHLQQAQDRDKCCECNSVFANEEYDGLKLCDSCFMKKTKVESEESSLHQKSPPVLSQQPRRPCYTPRFDKCQNHNCNNPKTETGYCDICNDSQIPTALMVQDIDSTGYIQSSQCYLCTECDLRDMNPICPEHKNIIKIIFKPMGSYNVPQTTIKQNYTCQMNQTTSSHYQNIPMSLSHGEPHIQATLPTAGQLQRQHHIWPQQYDHKPVHN